MGQQEDLAQRTHMANLSADERKLVLPMMKNYIEKYLSEGIYKRLCW